MDVGTKGGVEDVYIQNRTGKITELERSKYAAKSKPNMEAVDKAAEEFEAVFLSEMLQHMFAGVSMNPLGGGESEASDEIYKSMLVDEYGKTLSRAGGIGVAAHVKREMLRLQEVEQ